jgi:hypothetical protein
MSNFADPSVFKIEILEELVDSFLLFFVLSQVHRASGEASETTRAKCENVEFLFLSLGENLTDHQQECFMVDSFKGHATA